MIDLPVLLLERSGPGHGGDQKWVTIPALPLTHLINTLIYRGVGTPQEIKPF